VVALLLAAAAASSCRKGASSRSPVDEAHALAVAGRKQDAVKVLETAASTGTPDPGLLLALANLEESLYHFAQARRWFDRVKGDKRFALAAHYGLARMAWKEDDVDALRVQLEQLPKAHPNPLVAVVLATPLARTAEQGKAMRQRLETLRKQNPGFWADSAEVLAASADVQRLTGDMKAADASLERLRQTKVRDLYNALLLADLYRLWGRPAPALWLTHAVLRTEPKAGEAWVLLAQVAAELRDFGLADRALGKIPQKVASDPDLLMVKARVDRVHGRMATAIQSAEQAVKLVPPSNGRYHRRVRLALTELLLQAHQAGRARAEVDAILKDDPAWVPAFVASAAVSIEEQKPDEALTALAALDELGPRGRRVMELRGAALLAKGDTAGAERVFRRAIEQLPADPRGPLLLGMALAKRGDVAGARREWVRAMELAPGDAAIVERIIELDRKAGRREPPVDLVRAQLDRAPDSAGLRDLLGRLLRADGQVSLAEIQFRRALELAPGRTGTWLALADLFRSLDKHHDRLEALQKALALSPESMPIQLEIADAWRRVGKPRKTVEIYERALKRYPSAPPLLNNLALVYAGPLKQPARGLPLAEKALAQSPQEPRFKDTVGWIHYLQGKHDLALPLLREAAAKLEDPDVQFHLGMALWKAGDRRGAETRLRKALALSPSFEGSEEARRLLDSASR
jgi:tetratricopeptide (TPR) repeat protein